MSASIEVFEGKDKQFYVSLKASNGRILSTSEGYRSRAGAERAAESHQKAVLEIVAESQNVEEQLTEAGLLEVATTPEALDRLADEYGHLLHPTAVPSSAVVIGQDRQTLRDLLETAAEDGWTIIPPNTDDTEEETDDGGE